jgi:LytS/YehU family sensor histidine kinase
MIVGAVSGSVVGLLIAVPLIVLARVRHHPLSDAAAFQREGRVLSVVLAALLSGPTVAMIFATQDGIDWQWVHDRPTLTVVSIVSVIAAGITGWLSKDILRRYVDASG